MGYISGPLFPVHEAVTGLVQGTFEVRSLVA